MDPVARPAVRRTTRERHEALLKLLRGGTTHVEELADALGVSPSTVRRDLGRLTRDRKVARTYGGALVPEAFHERPVSESALVRRQAKAEIAATARSLMPRTGAVFLDAGSTCTALARHLAAAGTAGAAGAAAGAAAGTAAGDPPGAAAGDAPRGVVVTRGLETAGALTGAPGYDVLLLGGRILPLSHGLIGPLTDLALERLSFEVAFLGADAVDPERGVGEPTLEETAVKERVAARSRRVVVLADATKLRVPDAPAWTRLPPGWTLVTDADAPADLESRCALAGVTPLRAPRLV